MLLTCPHPPGETQDRDQQNDELGDDAVQAPDLEHVFLDPGESQGKCQAQQRGDEVRGAHAEEGEDAEERIAGDAECRNGDVPDFRELTVVDDAAVPVLVDAARGSRGGVVDLERERRDDDAANCEYGE